MKCRRRVRNDRVIVAVNESALLQLGCSNRKVLIGKPVSNFFQFDFETLEQRARTEPATIWPVRDVGLGRRFFALVRAPLNQAARVLAIDPVAHRLARAVQFGAEPVDTADPKSHVRELTDGEGAAASLA